MARTIVSVQIARDRTVETEREIRQYAETTGCGRPYRQGTSDALLWEFTGVDQLSRAHSFKLSVENTPGVVGIVGLEQRP
jgi:hypothetical protein